MLYILNEIYLITLKTYSCINLPGREMKMEFSEIENQDLFVKSCMHYVSCHFLTHIKNYEKENFKHT